MAQTPAEDPLVVVGSSTESFSRAADDAVREALRTIAGIRAVDVVALSAVLDTERIAEYRATVSLVLDD
jgi:flavin-binding protein dodecin